MKKRFYAIPAAAVLLAGCASAPSPPTPTDLSTVTSSQKISYLSANGVTGFPGVLAGERFAPQVLTSELFLPESCVPCAGLPAVIIQHGSGAPKHQWYPELARKLNRAGLAVLVANSYSARNIRSTTADQTRLSAANRVVDTFAAFRALQAIPCIDPARIGVTGYSFGGLVSRYMTQAVLAEQLGGGRVLKASLPVYPSCAWQWRTPRLTDTTMHYLLAELDDYTPARLCIAEIRRLNEAGLEVSHTVYPGAHHAFIADRFDGADANAQTFYHCGVSWIGEDGHYDTPAINASSKDGWGDYAKAVYTHCVKRGVTLGRDETARAEAMDFTVEFFVRNL